MKHELKRLKEQIAIWIVWRLPRPIVKWAFVRVATASYNGSPNDRTCGDALKAWG